MSLAGLGRLSQDDLEAVRLFARAIELGKEILDTFPEEQHPEECFAANEIIGSALRDQFERAKTDAESADLLKREIKAWNEAIRLHAKSKRSKSRTALQFSLASALRALSDFVEDAEACGLLDSASKIQEEALKFLDRNSEPERWIKAQEILGQMRSE